MTLYVNINDYCIIGRANVIFCEDKGKFLIQSIVDTAPSQKIPFILDRNLAKANCRENQVCTSCDTVVLGLYIMYIMQNMEIWTHWYLYVYIIIYIYSL